MTEHWFTIDEAQAKVDLRRLEQLGVSRLPGPVGQVRPQPPDRLCDLLGGQHVEDRDAVADRRVEEGLGAAPIGLEEAVAAVVRHGTGLISTCPNRSSNSRSQ